MTGNCRDHNDRENENCRIPQTGHFYPRQSYTPLFFSPSLFPHSVHCFFTILAPKPLERLGGRSRQGNKPVSVGLKAYKYLSVAISKQDLWARSESWHLLLLWCFRESRADQREAQCIHICSVVERWSKQFSLQSPFSEMSVNSWSTKMYKYMLKEKIYETSNMCL